MVTTELEKPVTFEAAEGVETAEIACAVPCPVLLLCPPEPATVLVSSAACSPASWLREPHAPNATRLATATLSDHALAFPNEECFPTFEPFPIQCAAHATPNPHGGLVDASRSGEEAHFATSILSLL